MATGSAVTLPLGERNFLPSEEQAETAGASGFCALSTVSIRVMVFRHAVNFTGNSCARGSNRIKKPSMPDLSESEPTALIKSKLLQSICRQIRFDTGDVLRQKGQHYRDMYVITDGRVEVDLESGRRGAKIVVSHPGFPIGEIGFLRGWPAMATVIARAPTTALVIDDPTLARLEHEQPALTAHLLRHLAKTAEERTSYNLTWGSMPTIFTKPQTIEVHLCRNKDMLERAQRLRYEVYCQELGRRSPYADHDRRIITDHLDDAGHTFVAIEDGETIGTLRANLSSEGSIGILEELYGMKTSRHHPKATGICTKFVVKKSKRGSLASMKLIAAVTKYGIRNRIQECYIDCIPALLPYYKAIGFKITGHIFFHRENGPSHPMVLDLARHGERLSKEGGVREYLGLIIKAQTIKWIDKVRGLAAP
jgi:predicted GNAT family N-acyltransferase